MRRQRSAVLVPIPFFLLFFVLALFKTLRGRKKMENERCRRSGLSFFFLSLSAEHFFQMDELILKNLWSVTACSVPFFDLSLLRHPCGRTATRKGEFEGQRWGNDPRLPFFFSASLSPLVCIRGCFRAWFNVGKTAVRVAVLPLFSLYFSYLQLSWRAWGL